MADADETLEHLFLRIAAGEKPALREVHVRLASRVFGIALAILRDRAAAADILQDTFLKLWQRAGQFDPARGNAEAWLLAITRYAALDLARIRGREATSNDPLLGDTPVDPDALDRLEGAEAHAALRDCLARLDPRYRTGIVLAFVHGLSHVEVAQHLDLPLGTVKSQIRRGLLTLRDCMG